jgi:murein L,D-transpeptidase YcbB/YkuD
MKADRFSHRSLILLFGLVIGLCVLFQSCEDAPAPALSPPAEGAIDSTAIKAAIQYEQDSIFTAFFVNEYLSNLLETGGGIIRGEKLFSDIMLPELYESCAYQMLWKDSLKRKHAIDVIANATADGLNPEDYHLSSILDLIKLNEDDYEVQSGLDILITDGIILYGTHLLNGKTDPKTLEPTLSYEQRVLSDEVLEGVRLRLISGDVQGVIEDLRPPSKFYDHMMDGLSYYEAIADSGAWKVVSISERKLEPGMSYTDIPPIRARMLAEGDLLLEDIPQATDSLIDLNLYDSGLQRAVERFQLRHGLNPDGIIGRGTVEAMNISVSEKIKLLKANMERARWIHHDLDSNYVLVNIAGFDLRLVMSDTLCWQTKVMTGKVATATPVFRDEMVYIEFNPYWTVPFSISNGEILPKLKKDPSYLSRNNMELLTRSGGAVNETELDYTEFDQKLPYIVRQRPGGANALGRVKFLFPNRFSVYLHDTPSRSLFAQESRAFSHGCIRVEDPLTFAQYVLHDLDYSRQQIDSIIDAKENYRVDLKKPLPVVITYSTSFADADLVYFYGDVYKRDLALIKALGL